MGKVATEQTLSKILANVSYLASGARGEMMKSFDEISAFIRAGDPESNRLMFPIGDQILTPWRDEDDENHSSSESAWTLIWDIAAHQYVTGQNGEAVPAMILMLHGALPDAMEFSPPQAAYNAGSALPAGTYCLTIGAGSGSSYIQGDIIEFTLTKSLPLNGRLSIAAKSGDSYAITSYAPNNTAARETVTGNVVATSSAASLGIVNEGDLNRINKVRYGSNAWHESGIRQWLNARGTGWFKSMDIFDLPPSYAGRHGFMSGFSEDFLAALKPIKLTSALNTASGFADKSKETYDTFFLASLEQLNVQSGTDISEGEYFEFWRRAQGLNTYAGRGTTNVYDCFEITPLGKTAPALTHTRSAVTTSPYFLYKLSNGGYITAATSNANCRADTLSYVQPCCAIC